MKCAATALFCLLFYPASLPAQSQKTLLLGLASISGGIETLYVTKKIGAFKRNGLDVDFLLLQGGSQALQVLLSGDIKLISGGGGTDMLKEFCFQNHIVKEPSPEGRSS